MRLMVAIRDTFGGARKPGINKLPYRMADVVDIGRLRLKEMEELTYGRPQYVQAHISGLSRLIKILG